MYEFFLAIHLYSIYASAFLMLVYLYLTQGSFKTEFDFIRRIRLFLPIYYTFWAVVLFTGSLLLSLKNFELNGSNHYMISSWIFILALNIVQFKLFKRARQTRHYKVFRASSFFILAFNLCLIVAGFLYLYGF